MYHFIIHTRTFIQENYFNPTYLHAEIRNLKLYEQIKWKTIILGYNTNYVHVRIDVRLVIAMTCVD